MSTSQNRAPQLAELASPRVPAIFIIVPTALALLAGIYEAFTAPSSLLAGEAAGCMVAWFLISLIFSIVSRRHLVPGFLGGLLFLLAGWRLAGPLGMDLVSWPAAIAVALYVLRFFDIAIADRQNGTSAWLTLAQWQLTFIRMYIAFDMIPHFTEKLFAGPVPFNEDAAILARYGMSPAWLYVLMGGLCELGVAIGLGLGILTRVAAVGAAFYFLITTQIGHHFGKGFIWNLNGGGWEYPLLMLCLFLSFAFTGGGRFSVDYLLAGCKAWPRLFSLLGVDRKLADERARR